MGKTAYSARVLVLRKANLGEADTIVHLLSDDGSLVRAVAKGARKPKSTFSSRLDLFSVCDCLIAPGRNLDVVSEARLIAAHQSLRCDIARVAAASPILDALSRCAQEGLPVPRLFDMACAALDWADACEERFAPAITAAFLVKLFAMLGLTPSFGTCIVCGEAIGLSEPRDRIDFSFEGGGMVCPACAGVGNSVRMDAHAVLWAQAFLRSTFEECLALGPSLDASFAVLDFCHRWLREHMGMNLKSMNYLMSCGLF